VLTPAGWDQTAGNRRHLFCAFFKKRFELSVLNILNVNRATHCLKLPPLEFETTWTVASALNPEPICSIRQGGSRGAAGSRGCFEAMPAQLASHHEYHFGQSSRLSPASCAELNIPSRPRAAVESASDQAVRALHRDRTRAIAHSCGARFIGDGEDPLSRDAPSVLRLRAFFVLRRLASGVKHASTRYSYACSLAPRSLRTRPPSLSSMLICSASFRSRPFWRRVGQWALKSCTVLSSASYCK
jgi:hypothetical protein